MAKLIFKYGAMNSGKTTILLQTAYNYEERDQRILILKPKRDTKGENSIVSRLNIKREVNYLVDKDDKIIDTLTLELNNTDCILVDEAQFLTPDQVYELYIISKIYNIPVIAYGLRSDFKQNGFPGSSRLLELADELEEIPTICRCGRKARFNGRKINGNWVTEGNQVEIDNNQDIEYESLCGECYLYKVIGYKKPDKNIKTLKKED